VFDRPSFDTNHIGAELRQGKDGVFQRGVDGEMPVNCLDRLFQLVEAKVV
jgi:hypothetical protein